MKHQIEHITSRMSRISRVFVSLSVFLLLMPLPGHAQLNIREVKEAVKVDDGSRYNGKQYYFDDRNLEKSEGFYKDQAIMVIPADPIHVKLFPFVYGFYSMNGRDTTNINDIDIRTLLAYHGRYAKGKTIDSVDRKADYYWSSMDEPQIYPMPIFTPRTELDGTEFIIRKASYKETRSEIWSGYSYRLLLEDKYRNLILFEGRPSESLYTAKYLIENAHGASTTKNDGKDELEGLRQSFYMMAPIHEAEKMIGKTYNLKRNVKSPRKFVMRKMEGGKFNELEGPLTCTELCYMEDTFNLCPCLVYTDSNGVEYYEALKIDSMLDDGFGKSYYQNGVDYYRVDYKTDLKEAL